VASVRNNTASTTSLTYTDPADRCNPYEKVMSFGFMHGSIDHSWAMVFTRCLPSRIQWRGAGHCFNAPFSMIERPPYTCDRLVNQVVEMLTMLPDFCRNICFTRAVSRREACKRRGD